MGAAIGGIGDATGNDHLQQFAAAFSRGYQRRAQMELDQRHQLAQSLAAIYPNANPDAQQDIAGRILQIYQTPWNKPLDKKLGDATTLGQKQFQQRAMEANGQAGQLQGPAQIPAATPNGQVTQSPMISPQGTATAGGGGQITNAGPANMTQAPGIPTPPAYPGPIMSPDQRNQLDANKIKSDANAHVAAYNATIRSIMEANPGMSPTEAAIQARIAMGGTLAGMNSIIMPRAMGSTPISGAEILQADPGAKTIGGQAISPEGFYTRQASGLGGSSYAPAGLAAEQVQTGINAKKGQYPTSNFNAYRIAYAEQHPDETPEQQLAGAVTEYNTHTARGFRLVPQKNGDTLMVPVTTSTGRGSLGGQAPSGGSIPAPPGGKAAQTTGAGGVKGTVVGGKYPPEVQKEMTTYEDAITRYNVMSEALPKALAGDQQAMINLLYNHIGMTTGLQKGARITRDIIEEAQNSAPWMATLLSRIGVGNEFTMTPTLMRGVTLPPEEMHNMIGLAEDRVSQEYDKLQSLKQQYQSGEAPTPDNVIKGGRQAQAGGKTPSRVSGTPPPAGGSKAQKAQVFHYDAQGNRVQ